MSPHTMAYSLSEFYIVPNFMLIPYLDTVFENYEQLTRKSRNEPYIILETSILHWNHSNRCSVDASLIHKVRYMYSMHK